MGNVKEGRTIVYNEITSEVKLTQVNPDNIQLEEDFLEYLESVDRSQGTISQYKANLHIFWCWNLEYNKNKFFVELTKRELVKFQNHTINEWGWSPSRIKTVMTLNNKMKTWLEKNSKASKEYGASINALCTKLNTLNSSGKLTESELKKIEQEFKNIQQSVIAAGKVGNTFGATFQKAFKSILQYVNVSMVIGETKKALQEMFNNVVEIDTAMTELKKVTNETSSSYSKFLTNAGSAAKEIGTTVSGLPFLWF